MLELLRQKIRSHLLHNFELRQNAIKQDLEKDYDAYLKMKEWFANKKFSRDEIVVYSPGSGCDMMSLLIMYDAIVSKKNKKTTFVLADTRDFFLGAVNQVRRYCKDARIKEASNGATSEAIVNFKDREFRIIFHIMDISSGLPKEALNKIDIYFERAFELFRSHDNLFADLVLRSIKDGGLLMTDHSFPFGRHAKNFKKLEGIPTEFGLYQNFQIWQKREMT